MFNFKYSKKQEMQYCDGIFTMSSFYVGKGILVESFDVIGTCCSNGARWVVIDITDRVNWRAFSWSTR